MVRRLGVHELQGIDSLVIVEISEIPVIGQALRAVLTLMLKKGLLDASHCFEAQLTAEDMNARHSPRPRR